MSILVEQTLNEIQLAGGINSNKPVVFGGTVTFNGARINASALAPITKYTPQAVNASATLTVGQILGGYITTTSGSAVTMTFPTGTIMGAAIPGVAQGTTFDLIIDNTAGSNTVTMAVGANFVQSDWDNQITTATASGAAAPVLPLAIVSGVSGIGVYKITFSSATACVFSRTA